MNLADLLEYTRKHVLRDKAKPPLTEAQSLAQITTSLFNNLHTGATLNASAVAGTSISTSG